MKAACVLIPAGRILLVIAGLVAHNNAGSAGQTADVATVETVAYLATFIEHPALSECATRRYGVQLHAAGLARFALEPQAPDCTFAACNGSRIRGLADYRDKHGALLRTALFMDPPKIPIASPLLGESIPFSLVIDGNRVRVFAPPALPLAAPLSQVCQALATPLKPLSEA
ncbi:hypothetical protein QSH33_020070 [Xanthomonas arboricola pv. pruni]|uniref:hypothetical protein n=1 Tax=Xanthomonas arboricola TaxID=56448 RepID=UPI0035EDA352